MWLKYSTAQLMIKWMIMRSALGFTELDEMIEVDENDKIETMNLDLDQGDCVGHVGGVIGGGVSLCVCVCVCGMGGGGSSIDVMDIF
jgi:hypothetical protein